MSARAARGDIGGALSTYNALWEVLDKEHDVEPSDQTQQLVARIKMAQPLSRVEANAPPMALVATAGARTPALLLREITFPLLQPPQPVEPKLIVSIGAFDVSGAREDQRYLVHGFRRELIACLVRFREWLVCDQATMPGDVPSTDGPTSEFVIEASAFQEEDGLRLVLMLKEAATKTYLWSERFQISMTRWLDAQQTIVRRLATALNVHLSAGRLASHAQKPADDLKGYDLWLQGQALVLSFLPTDWHKAVEIFREVIARTPAFAPAYSSLAQLHNTIHYSHPGVFRNPSRMQEALDYAREATRLDPVDSRGQLCLGWAYALSGNFELGAVHHSLAQELNDNDPWTLLSSGLGFAFGGDIERAQNLAQHAMQLTLNPSAIHWRYQAIIRFMDNDYEGCVAAAQSAERMVPNALGWKAAALQHLGRHGEAKKEVANFFQIVAERWFGNDQVEPTTMARWFLHAFPIRRREDWERLRDGFAGAGAPVKGITHEGW
jgi:TolB-like protein